MLETNGDNLPDAPLSLRRSSRLLNKTTKLESTSSSSSGALSNATNCSKIPLVDDKTVSCSKSDTNVPVEPDGHLQNGRCNAKFKLNDNNLEPVDEGTKINDSSSLEGAQDIELQSSNSTHDKTIENNLESVDKDTKINGNSSLEDAQDIELKSSKPTLHETIKCLEKVNIPPHQEILEEEDKNNIKSNNQSSVEETETIEEQVVNNSDTNDANAAVNTSVLEDLHNMNGNDREIKTFDPSVQKTPIEDTMIDNEISEKNDSFSSDENTRIDNEISEEQPTNNNYCIDTENHVDEKSESTTANKVVRNNGLDDIIDKAIYDMDDYSDSSDDEHHQNSFIDSMAEEGEEDTPSDGSNDIVEIGEEINTTESELSTDEAYENNSFLDDSESYQLLSGEEYDLSIDDYTKRTRIVQLSSDSDVSIVRVNTKKKKKLKKPKKKSRIIRFASSSDEEAVTQSPLLSENQDMSKDPVNSNCDTISSSDVESKYLKEATNVSKIYNTENEVTEQKLVCSRENHETDKENTEWDALKHTLTPSPTLEEVKSKECPNKKIIILENIKVQDICNKELSDHVNTIINSYSSEKINGLKSSSSVECSDNEQFNANIVEHQQITSPPASTGRDTTEIIDSNSELVVETNIKKNKKSRRKQKKRKQNLTPYSNLQINSKPSTNSSERLHRDDFNSEVNTPDEAFNHKKIKKRKRKHCPENNESIRKKQKILGDIAEANDTSLLEFNILAEDISHDTEREFDLRSDIFSKGYKRCKLSHKTEMLGHKTIGKKTPDTNTKSKQFHVKDFKGLMLYDSSRIKRIDTQKLVHKKNTSNHHIFF